MIQMSNFIYSNTDLSGYRTKMQYDGFVSHIDPNSAHNSRLFIIDTEFPLGVNLWEEVIEWIEHIPMPGIVFGIDLGVDGIFRAVRDNVLSQSASVMLIDSGETLKASELKNCTLLKLSKMAQSLPAYAIPCKVAKIYDSDGEEISMAAASLLHESIKFDVVGIDQPLGDMLLVNIFKKPSPKVMHQSSLNPFAAEFQMPAQLTLPVYDAIASNHEMHTARSDSHVAAMKSAYSLENYKINQIMNDCSEVSPSASISAATNCANEKPITGCIPKARSNGVNALTKEELEELYEEPLNTSNALKAVMGYAPKDDERICRFYDSNTGKCFKGNNCKFEHVPTLRDGWTRDRCLTTTKIPGLQKIPNAHETVCIIPTYVASVEEFYAYVPCACDCESKMDPKQLKELMNTPENRTKYEPVRKFPEIFELVFVKYLDDQFYRAKVTDLINDETHVLFFVDYGFSCPVDPGQLYEWKTKWDYVPFLARRCYLVNVKMRWPNDEEALKELEKRILRRKMKILVEFSSPDESYVRLTDEDGLDIGQLMCEHNFASKGNYVPYSDEVYMPA